MLSGIAGCDAQDSGLRTGSHSPTTAAAVRSATLPRGLPSYFSFGLMNALGDVGVMDQMRSENGAAWDFRYQILSGGVNTGRGWETWQSPAGAYVTQYLQESTSHHYIPVLVYNDLLQSAGGCPGCDAEQGDLTRLNDSLVMSAYFANWRLLMQQVGVFGKPALVIAEPGLWGYAESSVFAESDSATAVPASVASSGDADAAAFPNTLQGFAWTLLHIRDRYAPNAMLAIDVSPSAAGDDISSSTNPDLDVAYDVKTTASFLDSAGLMHTPSRVSSWDVLTADVADRDSGQGAAWWDPSNQVFPNFTRYLSFAAGISQATGRNILLWQVPEGNQYFATENDSPHHSQDNRAQYILAHVVDFAQAGIVGVLFGLGNGGTSVDDAAHDGVSNPPPISSYQCDHCNTHLSAYPDDDGGYLRLFVGAYYRHGPLQLARPQTWTAAPGPAVVTVTPLPAGTCEGTPSAVVGTVTAKPNPVAVGGSYTITPIVTVSCNTAVCIKVELYTGRDDEPRLEKDNVQLRQAQPTPVSLAGVIPTTLPAGRYPIHLGVYALGCSSFSLYYWDSGSTSIVVS
jgi:hypothetical protein